MKKMENLDFEYKASIIVPVYNVEPFLAQCLDSLINQTISSDQMEILCINDGSTDNSLQILREYEKKYKCIKVFSKENEGLSATRNYGIQRATGKYLMFIDSDDMFSPLTVKSVTDYFDTVYNQVDMVTYFEQPYSGEKDLPCNRRYNLYLKKDGIYDLNKYPYIMQARINVCVKNMGSKNVLFDTTPGFRQEDQEYCNRVLMPKMKLGYCSAGRYLYNKGNAGSIVSSNFNVLSLFETSTAYYETLFSHFKGKVPAYFQVMFLNDIRWKFDDGKLFPYHYDKENYIKARKRIINLLNRTDVDTILNMPSFTRKQKFFWLMQKENANITPYSMDGKYALLCNGKTIFSRNDIELYYICAKQLDNGNISFRLYVADPIYNFLDKPADVFVLENNTESKKMHVFLSSFGFHKSYEYYAKFYSFEYECNPDKVSIFKFYVKIGGYVIEPDLKLFKCARFNRDKGIYDYVEGDVRIQYQKSQFCVTRLTAEQTYQTEITHTNSYTAKGDSLIYPKKVRQERLEAIEYRKNHRVWLYSDLYTVKKDNAYYQFQHDFSLNDGVERYYVYTRDYDEIKDLFTPQQQKYLVEFASREHRLLYLSAEIILSAFFGRTPISPFEREVEEMDYYDIEHFKVIYLQHGVLHASLYVANSAENMRADKIVVSSYFEKKNYIEKYHYRPDQIVSTGMARYDYIDRTKKAKNRILFAPSWRNYLAPNDTPSSWKTNLSAFKKSDYYCNIKAFVESEKLNALLEKHDMYFELKLHPIIARDAAMLFKFKSKRVVLAKANVDVTDYKMFITDFSSFVFDYAWLNRPILYFVPDMVQFKAGMGHYRELDLPFEEAFGPLAVTPEQAADETEKIFQNSFKPEQVYYNRMKNFYLPMNGNCRKDLYKYIKSNMKF